MTGAELRAWRERLGKDEAWAAQICAELSFAFYRGWPRESKAGRERRDAAEGDAHWDYSQSEADALRTAYAAALEAEEARQAAERGPVEPVCPEGVTVERVAGACFVVSCGGTRVSFTHDGKNVYANGCTASAAALRYAADLSEYRAAIHAASDRQRKLDAVKAAEEAQWAAERAIAKIHDDYHEALDAARVTSRQASSALVTARREAGL